MNPDGHTELFSRLFGSGDGPKPPASILVVVAHPDDEAIGAGAWLRNREHTAFVHVTDGAPLDMKDARENGFESREDYAFARRGEFQNALKLLGITPRREIALNYIDQEASLNLANLASQLQSIIVELSPEVILSLPYEGGHPDHDAVAWALAAACNGAQQETGARPLLVEMTCYHNGSYGMVAGEFLPGPLTPVSVHQLGPEQCAFKRSLYACYASQQRTLRWFPIEVEAFRVAPCYDFLKPPHEGKLFYEQFKWGMTGIRWRSLASQALNSVQPSSFA
jgi:LmbE family N-acetylglucosaminyl deacetylase